jgi:hypothetical protein
MSTRHPDRTSGSPPILAPILAPNSGSAAIASDPDLSLEGQHYHIYEAHPAPWWIAALWVAFFVFAVTYLITNLLQ